jgi:hypothetical protein
MNPDRKYPVGNLYTTVAEHYWTRRNCTDTALNKVSRIMELAVTDFFAGAF